MGTHCPLQRREQQAVILWENRKVDIPTVHNLALLPFLFNGSQRKSGYTLSRRVNKRRGRLVGGAEHGSVFFFAYLYWTAWYISQFWWHVFCANAWSFMSSLVTWNQSCSAEVRMLQAFAGANYGGTRHEISYCGSKIFTLQKKKKKMHADSFGTWWCFKAPGEPQIRLF